MKNYFNNSILPLLLIISIVLTPLGFIPKKAEATGISGYISGLSGVITDLPLCQGKITNLFSGNGQVDIEGTLTDASSKLIQEKTKNLSEKAKQADNEGINVIFQEQVTDYIAKTSESTKSVEKETKAASTNDTCLKSIGRIVVKMLLQKITLSTVEWINSGFDGSPMFIENSGEFFKDIAKNEILQFGIEIGDPELFPFGADFMQRQATAFQRHFADNAQYSLNKIIEDTNPGTGYNAATFNADFSQGGWSAWEALTQVPANNPMGFSLMASNELQKRLEGTSQSTAQTIRDQLKEAGGYLGKEVCRSPEGVTRAEHNRALAERASNPNSDPNSMVWKDRLCTGGWKYVTPGQIVSEAASKTINYPDNNLLSAQDLNDAVAAILDALLNSFSSSFMGEDGFAGLSDNSNFREARGSDSGFVIDESNLETFGSSVGENYTDLQIAGSSFLQQNPNFDITMDLTQGLIDEQRIFVDKIIGENKELLSTVPLTQQNNPTGKYTGFYGLIPTIYQLDYCIPGPHPGWEQDSKKVLKAALDTIIPETTNSLEDRSAEEVTGIIKESVALVAAAVGTAIGAVIFSEIPVVGTLVGAVIGAVVGYLVGFIVDLFNGADGEELAREYYNGHLYALAGIRAMDCRSGRSCTNTEDDQAAGTPSLHNKTPFSNAIKTILQRYTDIVYDIYKPEDLPSITEEANQKYFQIKGYYEMYKNNEERVTALKSVVVKLNDLREKIIQLKKDLTDKTIKDINGNIAPLENIEDVDGNIITLGQEAQYRENLKILTEQFARISQDMITGDDIAIVDNTIKQIKDETKYIYNVLLKGPRGCEASVEFRRGADGKDGSSKLPWATYDAKKPYLGIPILYDYNNFTNGSGFFPDPFGSGFEHRYPSAIRTDYAAILPGVMFENNDPKHRCGNWNPNINGPLGEIRPPLCWSDLFKTREYSDWVWKRWEKTIGIF